MPRFIVRWDAGFGDCYVDIEADDYEDALKVAHDHWKEDVESQADFDAEEYTEEKAEEYGL